MPDFTTTDRNDLRRPYTGNEFLDKLYRGPYIKNPAYKATTKKGRSEPEFILDTEPGNPNIGAGRNFEQTIEQNRHYINYGTTDAEHRAIERAINRGIPILNPYNTEEENNILKASRQSTAEKWGNALMQAGVGEALIGTLKGFFEIYDGIANSFTGNAYDRNFITQWLQDVQNDINEKYEIYRRDPNASWDMGDAGWWAENSVSIASTLSLMLPAAGWTKGLSFAGKLLNRTPRLFGVENKLLSKYISRGLMSQSSKISEALAEGDNLYRGSSKISILRQAANSEAKIRQTAQEAAEIGLTATFSRAGENMQEARQVYDDVYENSRDNLNNMPEEEFKKFLSSHPEFRGKSTDEIAQTIARNSANKTFANDWWMLLQDVMQFKALGTIWGKMQNRATTAGERIALRAAKQKLAGVEAEKVIQDNILNRVKEVGRYAVTHPMHSVGALELGEGFEEFFQGVQQDKGMEVATKYFDPNATPRTLDSYLRDPSMWEQGFWGAVGGIVFGNAYSGLRQGVRKGEAFYKKKTGHYSQEQYENETMTEDKIRINQLNGFQARAEVFVNNMQELANGRNPFSYKRDLITKRKIYNEDGSIKHETLDQAQQTSLINDAIDQLVVSEALNSVDNGNFALMKELIKSPEFSQFLQKQGISLSATDTSLAQSVAERMQEVADAYIGELQNVNDIASEVNPFINKLVAREIISRKLEIEGIDRVLNNIANQRADILSRSNDNDENYRKYVRNEVTKQINKELKEVAELEKKLENARKENKIGKTAYNMQIRNLNNQRLALLNYMDNINGTDIVKQVKEDLSKVSEGYAKIFEDNITKYMKSLEQFEGKDIPIGEIKQNYTDEMLMQIERVKQQAMLPQTDQQYKEMYDEMAYSADETARNRLNGYMDAMKNFLRGASTLEEFDRRWQQFLNEDNLTNELKEAAQVLKYGYWKEDKDGKLSLSNLARKTQLETIYNTLREQKEERLNADRKHEEKTGVKTPQGATPEELANARKKKDENDKKNDKKDNKKDEEKKSDKKDNTSKEDISLKNEQESERLRTLTSKMKYQIKQSIALYKDEMDEQIKKDKIRTDLIRYLENIGEKNMATSISQDNNAFNRLYNKCNEEIASFIQRQEGKKMLYSGESTDLGKSLLDVGFGEKEDAEVNAETETVDHNITEAEKERIKNVVEHFLDLYSSAIKSVPTTDGKHIINLDTLFRHLMRNTRRVVDRQIQQDIEDYFKINSQPLDINFIVEIYNNLSKYIASFSGEKYIFTGLNKRYKTLPDFDTFINALKENWQQQNPDIKNVHMFPVSEEERTENFADAVFYAARGFDGRNNPIKVNIRPENEYGCLYVTISYTDENGRKKEDVPIGFFRATTMSATNDAYLPSGTFYGLQNRMILRKDGKYHLEYEDVFNEIIDQKSENAVKLLTSLVNYYNRLSALQQKYENIDNNEEYEKERKVLLSDEELAEIYNNPIMDKLRSSDMLRDNPRKSQKENTYQAMNAIANILLYGQSFDTNVPTSEQVDNLSANSVDMRSRLETWAQKLENNYKQGIEIQKAINNGSVLIPTVKVGYNTHLNTVEEGEERVNIADTVLGPEDPGLNAPECKLVKVDNGQFITEDGTVLDGLATPGINNHSYGFVLWDRDGVRYVAYIGEEVDLENGSELKEAVKGEIEDCIKKQLQNIVGTNNIDSKSHHQTFDEVRNRLQDIYSLNSHNLFKFYAGPRHRDVIISGAPGYTDIDIVLEIDDNGKIVKKETLLTLYEHKNGDVGESNAISILCLDENGNIEYDENGKPKHVTANGIVNGKVVNVRGNDEQNNIINEYYNRAINRTVQHLRLNKSDLGFVTNSPFREQKGKQSRFVASIAGKPLYNKKGKRIEYRSYKDMMIQNRAFTTNVKRGKSGRMVDAVINYNNITFSTGVADVQRQSVSDLCFSKERPRRTTVSMQDLVRTADPKYAGQAEVLEKLGFAKTIYLDHQPVTESTPYMKTVTTRNKNGRLSSKIYITERGATEMNNNGFSAIRLIVHENIHRQLAETNPTRKQRILNDIEHVYNYVLGVEGQTGVIDSETGISKFTSEEQRVAIKRVFENVSSKYAVDRNIGLEEFLVECMSQPEISEWLNKISWINENEANASNVNRKTILQKIIEFVMDLFGIDSKDITDGSVLARTYVIVGADSTRSSIGNNVSPDTNVIPETEQTSEGNQQESIVDNSSENQQNRKINIEEEEEDVFAETETVSTRSNDNLSQIDASISIANQTKNSLTREQASSDRSENVQNVATYVASYVTGFQELVDRMVENGEIEYSCRI